MSPSADGPAEFIRQRIRASGPISFAEFMDLALYGPGGFYENPPVGESGHFVTSPHVHPVFGLLLARAITRMWDAMGGSGPPAIIEVGAGDGTLASQLLAAIPDARYEAVERSRGARERLGEKGIPAATDLSELGSGRTAIVIANELLDNMPFHRVRMTAAGLLELRVDLDGSRFVETEADRAPAHELTEAAPSLEEGEEAAVSLEVPAFLRVLASVLGRGYALLIDYERPTGREPRGGVHGYREHRVTDDVLADPGAADITAGVDFLAVSRVAAREGLQAFAPTTQRQALLALGFDRWMDEQREAQGRRLDRGAGLEAVRTWSERNAAQLLVDRQGLGGLCWMTLATQGLPAPDLATANRD